MMAEVLLCGGRWLERVARRWCAEVEEESGGRVVVFVAWWES